MHESNEELTVKPTAHSTPPPTAEKSTTEFNVRSTPLQNGKMVVKATIKPDFQAAQAGNVRVLVDLSSSMNTKMHPSDTTRYAAAVQSIEKMLEKLPVDTMITIIGYARTKYPIYCGTVGNADPETIKHKLNTAHKGAAGTQLLSAVEQLTEAGESILATCVLILTDGEDFSPGGVDAIRTAIINRVFAGDASKAQIFAVGIGEYDQVFLQDLTGSRYNVVAAKAPQDLRRVFENVSPLFVVRKYFKLSVQIGEQQESFTHRAIPVGSIEGFFLEVEQPPESTLSVTADFGEVDKLQEKKTVELDPTKLDAELLAEFAIRKMNDIISTVPWAQQLEQLSTLATYMELVRHDGASNPQLTEALTQVKCEQDRIKRWEKPDKEFSTNAHSAGLHAPLSMGALSWGPGRGPHMDQEAGISLQTRQPSALTMVGAFSSREQGIRLRQHGGKQTTANAQSGRRCIVS